MSRLTLQEYLNERIKNVEYYIEFNERKDNKDFFAHKELELYQMAQKYMQLSNELGCPLDVVFKALKQNEVWIQGNYFSNVDALRLAYWEFAGYWTLISITHELGFPVKDYKKTWWLKEDLSE